MQPLEKLNVIRWQLPSFEDLCQMAAAGHRESGARSPIKSNWPRLCLPKTYLLLSGKASFWGFRCRRRQLEDAALMQIRAHS